VQHKPPMPGLIIERAGLPHMTGGAKVFARAMGREDAGIEKWLSDFSSRLLEAGICYFFVARHEHKIVGYGSLSAYERIGWIGFMGTEPGLQGQGIGAAMMEELLGLARHLGLTTVKLDATNIGKRLYSKFGFREEYPVRMCEIPGLCSRGTRRDGTDGVKLAEELPEWCRWVDRRAFGDNRSALIVNALEHGAKVLIIPDRGYALLDGRKLGPLVAMDPETAKSLLACASNLGAGLIYVPHHPGLPREFLAALRPRDEEGPITCCTRMHFGEALEQELALVYADYSAATG